MTKSSEDQEPTDTKKKNIENIGGIASDIRQDKIQNLQEMISTPLEYLKLCHLMLFIDQRELSSQLTENEVRVFS